MLFAEWVSAYTAGYIARREGLDDSDGEAFLKAMHDAYEQSGGQRAKRGEEPPESVWSPGLAGEAACLPYHPS